MQVFYTLISVLAGYNFCNLFTHPNSNIWKNYPRLKIKGLELLPSIRILIKGKIIHFHHWFNLTLLLCVSIFVTGGILDSWITRGALLGGIIQGLTTPSPNARKIIYHKKIDVQL